MNVNSGRTHQSRALAFRDATYGCAVQVYRPTLRQRIFRSTQAHDLAIAVIFVATVVLLALGII